MRVAEESRALTRVTTGVRHRFAIWLALALSTGACGVNDSNSEVVQAASQAVTTGASQVACGGPALGSFAADTNFSGGTALKRKNRIDLSGAIAPGPMELYQSQRSGDFSYTFSGFQAGAANTIRLHFADTHWGAPGFRTFNVTINGVSALSNFDVVAAAGAGNKALVKEVTQASDSAGKYLIKFTTVKDAAMVSGIEIVTGMMTVSVPKWLAPLAPVLVSANRLHLGAAAQVITGTSVAMATGGLDTDPDAVLNDGWSRDIATLRDRTRVHGTLHAKMRILGNNVVIDATDLVANFDPVTSLSWPVKYPTGAPAAVTISANQKTTLAPGLYGTVRLNGAGTLTLKTGTYYLTDLDIEAQSTVKLDQANGPVFIYATGTVILRSVFTPLVPGTAPELLLGYLGKNAFRVESLFNGAIISPLADFILNSVSGTHTGFFAGRNVSLDGGAKVQYRAPNWVMAGSTLPLTDCASKIVPRSDLTGNAREVAFQTDIARYCSMAGAPACSITIAARTNVDYSTSAMSLIGEVTTPAQFLSVVRDRARKEAAADADPTLAALICNTPDQDLDLVPDSKDKCPNTPPLTATTDDGCTDSTLPDAPSPTDVSQLIASGKLMVDPRCSGAFPLPDEVAGAFYYPSDASRGSYIVAGRVTNQPVGCPVWYVFDIEVTPNTGAPQLHYQAAFGDTEEVPSLVGLGRPVPLGFIQFNPKPAELGTRGLLAAVGGTGAVRFRVRSMNGGGMRSEWSGWKHTTRADCTALGFECAK